MSIFLHSRNSQATQCLFWGSEITRDYLDLWMVVCIEMSFLHQNKSKNVKLLVIYSLKYFILYIKGYQSVFFCYFVKAVFLAVKLSVCCFCRLSTVKQPPPRYLPLWTQKNMKSILHAFQAGKFCYWVYCFIMVSIIDIYELWNKT